MRFGFHDYSYILFNEELDIYIYVKLYQHNLYRERDSDR